MTTDARGRVRIEDGPKRIRAYLGGEVVADTTAVKLVWEKPYYPSYYFPRDDVRTELLVATDEKRRSPSRGDAHVFDLKGPAGTVPGAAYTHPDSPIEQLRDLVAFRWEALDHWFEEDEEVYVHARDPHTRVDALRSSRHVRIEVDGVTVADTHAPVMLFETGLPTRYYLPKTDVRLDLLTPTDTLTYCPYKGEASYWSLDTGTAVHEDLVWSYRYPVLESAGIESLVCFYNEKVDVFVDGELQERPKTHFA